MPNDTTPTKTLMIIVEEITPSTNPKTYHYVYVGDLDSLPSDILTESDIVSDLSTGGSDKVLSAEAGRELGEGLKKKQIYISTETNRSEDILLFRELILNKNTTNFDYNESEHTLYCYDENQTRKEAFIKKKQMLKDEIYFLTIRIEGDKGLLSMFFSEEIDDSEEEKAPEIDASFTFNLNKHDFTQELRKKGRTK